MVGLSTQANNTVPAAGRRLLVFNRYEPWVYQLRRLGMPLDIVDDNQPARRPARWHSRVRSVPSQARLLDLDAALAQTEAYHCILTHRIQELLDVKFRPEPKLLILDEVAAGTVDQRHRLLRYLALSGVLPVALSDRTHAVWGGPVRVVHAGVDAADYPPHSGHLACGLQVRPLVCQAGPSVGWDRLQAVFSGLPLVTAGSDPAAPGSLAIRDWDHLRAVMRDHRFYLHAVDSNPTPGQTWGRLEAMAAGLPILESRCPDSPVQHGISGFQSDDPHTLRHHAERLLACPEEAYRMGQAARRRVLTRYPLHDFLTGMLREIEAARQRAATVCPPDVLTPLPAETPVPDPRPEDAVPAATV